MDDWPPWKDKPDNSHAGRILALANCIHEMHYTTEQHAKQGPIKTFDNMCAADLEKAARVLAQAGFTRFIDDIGRRSVFVVEPTDFKEIAHGPDAQSLDVDQVCEAIDWLANGHFRSSDEIVFLAQAMR
ncbi:MAG: hypothetical protein HRU31_19015 [Rhodobacteraceae bacterium]|nr:hypothetical protein [Paracoccaceae bacterium]